MKTECIKLEPLVSLDDNGKSMVIDYHLPQINERNLVSYIQLKYPKSTNNVDQDEGGIEDEDHSTLPPIILPKWKNIFDFSKWLLEESSKPSKKTLRFFPAITHAKAEGFYKIKTGEKIIILSLEKAKALFNEHPPSQTTIGNILLANKSLVLIYKDVVNGNIINVIKNPKGDFTYSTKKPLPKKPKIIPKKQSNTMIGWDKKEIIFFLQFHLKMLTYPGKTGMGKVVKVLSLLPGEEAEFFSSNYLSNETSRKECENIIDSSSTSCEQETYDSLKKYNQQNSSESSLISSYENEFWTDVDADYWSIGIAGSGDASVEGGFSSKSESFSSAVSEMASNFSAFVTSKTNKSNQFRKYEIQTETYVKDTSGEFESVKRILKNINNSHVLNYIFRQIMQEYISLTYIDSVSILVPDENSKLKSLGLTQFEDYLNKTELNKKQINRILGNVYQQLGNIYDYENKSWNLIEVVPQELKLLDVKDYILNTNSSNLEKTDTYKNPTSLNFPQFNAKQVFYKRIKKNIKTTFNDMEINGIILNATKRVLNTPSVIVDAILGNGEALDCFNRKLRELDIDEKILKNKELKLALSIIESLTDPIEKANFFNECFNKKNIEAENTD